MAAGKPVIGVAEGGLLESVVDGETGFLIPEYRGQNDFRKKDTKKIQSPQFVILIEPPFQTPLTLVSWFSNYF